MTEEVGKVTRKVVHSNVGKPTQMRIIGGMVSEVAKDWNMNFELGQLEDVNVASRIIETGLYGEQ